MKNKLIEGYDWPYTVWEDGRITGGRRSTPLRHGIAAGYPRVVLYRDKRPHSKTIHRLLAEAFIPNPDNLPQVNHINGDTTDFRLSNLEWCTASYNVRDGYNRGRDTGWGTTRPLINRTKICEYCRQPFQRKKPQQRFCNNRCASYASIELFRQGILTLPAQ